MKTSQEQILRGLKPARDDEKRAMAGIGVPRLRFAPLGMTTKKEHSIGTAKEAAEKVEKLIPRRPEETVSRAVSPLTRL